MNPVLAARQQHRSKHEVSTRYIVSGEISGILRSQDCTPIAEYAKAQHNAGMFGTSEMKHAARLPDVIVEKYCNACGITFSEFMQNPVHIKRIVQDPMNSDFRIWKGNF